jgi:hypothetical protein
MSVTMRGVSVILLAVVGMSACRPGIPPREGLSYTLYRSGGVTPDVPPETAAKLRAMRAQVATFDSGEGEAFNEANCQSAAKLFEQHEAGIGRYWCEKGVYRP